MTARSSTATGFAAVVMLALSVSSPAAAAPVCGDTITQDTTLNADILNCAAGLTIGADNVTLDLNGHTIDGPQPIVDPQQAGTGISSSGRAGVSVRNGNVEDFRVGISFAGTRDSVLRNVTSIDNQFGLLLSGQANDNLIVGGLWNSNELYGMLVLGGSRNRLLRNIASNNQSTGIGVSSGAENRLERNSVVLNGANGIALDRGAVDTEIRGNHVAENGFAGGISVQELATGTLVRSNVAVNNFGDGINVRSPVATVQRNTANFNFDFGIEAVPAVNDGGRNRARGNGNPAQCLNVVCGP